MYITRYADINDVDTLIRYDNHIARRELENSVKLNRVIVSYEAEKFIGWLRYNLFWDNTPFMNMLFIIERERRKGYGEKLMVFWEQEMKRAGYNIVLTSTQSDERGQFFYRKHGYTDCGVLILPDTVSEILLCKNLKTTITDEVAVCS